MIITYENDKIHTINKAKEEDKNKGTAILSERFWGKEFGSSE